jgi:hypothetical protein
VAIPDAEVLQPPGPARLAAVQSAALRDGWAPYVAPLRAAAMRAYAGEKLSAAEAWFYVYRWAALFAEQESIFVPRWVQAINTAKVGHAGLNGLVTARAQTLGAALSPELQAWLVGNVALSAEFFVLVSPVDYLPKVFSILEQLHRADPARFKAHANLALAIALVFDVPPPPNWPHGQVSPTALPRKFAEPLAAFAWWLKQEQLGRTYHRFSRLGVDELKFVIDTAAPFAELDWAAKMADYPLGQLDRAYTMVRYRNDRVANNVPNWPGATYRMADILKEGGICCDQAYFATQVGKARGVPTLFFHGAGNDGRHAWFGFLDGNQKWQLNAGRYAEQRFVTGYARDPQTWREISDHELQFLSERFRVLPSYRQSQVHAAFAADFLNGGDALAAGVAARKAVSFERRNQAAWDTLVAAAQAGGRDAKTVEALWREAALAFQRNYDLEAFYVARVADSLRARGQVSEADAELKRIADKNKSGRSDLTVQQARETVLRSFAGQTLAQQVATFNTVLDTRGRGAGVGFFDGVVVVFAEHMVQLQQNAEAIRAVERARRTLKVEANSQLEQEITRLLAKLKGTK